MKEKECIILDYDGTLHDSFVIYGAAFRKAMKDLEAKGLLSPRSYEDAEIRQWIGLSVTDMWNVFQPDLSEEEKAYGGKLIGHYMEELLDLQAARLYPNVVPVLESLKESYELIFLSNCKRSYMEGHKKQFLLERYFTEFYCSEDFSFIPKEEIFQRIKKRDRHYLVVGDRRADLMLARAHGLPFVGCLYGYAGPGELTGADALIGDIRELPGIIHKLMEREEYE